MGLFTKKEKKPSQFKKVDEDTYVDQQTGEVITTYIPARKARQVAKSVLRIGKMKLFLLSALLIIAVLFIIAFMQEKQGNFVINLDRLELFRKGISISADADFTNPTAKLVADSIENATNIAFEDIPVDVNDIDGSHNGKNYMAYTYYIRNAGKEDVDYSAIITMDSASKGAEYAVRVGVWKNNQRIIYAEPTADGTPEPNCTNFESHKVVCTYLNDSFEVGDVEKFTIVIWLDGDDPQCVDSIVGGALEFNMKLASASKDDSSLLDKFIEDIRDTVNGEEAIGAAGTDSPDYAQYQNVNWNTRKNQ